MEDIELLDYLKRKLNFRTDVELAGYLGLTKSAISMVRTGEATLGPAQRLKILDHINYLRVGDWTQRLLTGNLAGAIREHLVNHGLAMALPSTEAGTPPMAEIELLDLIKTLHNLDYDAQVGPLIGLKPSAISMIRRGKNRFGLLPRARILRMLDPELPLEIFENALESSEFLLKLVKEQINN